MKSTPVNSLATSSLVLGLAGWFIYLLQWCFDLSLGMVLALTTAGAGAVCSAGLDILPFVLWVAGIVSGHAALVHIRRTSKKGHARAVAGLVLSYIGLFLVVILVGVLTVLVAMGVGAGWLQKLLPFHKTVTGFVFSEVFHGEVASASQGSPAERSARIRTRTPGCQPAGG